jgi:HPt (histidine-containing phosphotransfer) domain-containing protein
MLAKGDFVSAKELVHKIKGASGTIGAMRLYAASVALEDKLKDELSATFDNFREAFNQTMSVTDTLHQPENLMLLISGNSESLKRSAIELDQLLKENDFISESLLSTLKSHLALDQLDLFAQLRKLINDLHYVQAREALKRLVELSDT